MPTLGGRNKYRVYIAYFPRRDGATYHSALHIVPKNPKTGAAGTRDCWRIDVHDLAVRVDGEAVARWTYGFQAESGQRIILEYPGQRVDARSRQLLAMVLVGKLKASVSVDALREFVHRAVDLGAHDVTDRSWRCHQFVMEVIDAMNAGGLFAEPLAQTGQQIWNSGTTFATTYRPYGFQYDIPLPVCDTHGQAVESEIPAAPHLAQSDQAWT